MGLDFQKQGVKSEAAMRSFRIVPVEFLLSVGRSQSGRCSANESDRRAIYEDAVLWEPEDGRVFESSGTHGESETDSKTDASDGDPGDLSRSQYQPAADGSYGVSISFEKHFDRSSQSGLERGYHVYPAFAGFCLSRGDSGLVLPICSGVETLEQSGDGVLHGGSRGRLAVRESRHFQHGSGMPVHQRGFHEAIAGAGNPNQHGLSWTRLRQHFQRETLEERQIRGGLSEELSNDDRGSNGTGKLFLVLQQ